jgi:hypothetical protein
VIHLLHQLCLLIGIETGKYVEKIAAANHTQILKGRLHNLAYPQSLKTRGTLKEQPQFISGNSLELREIVVLSLACNLKSHLSEGTDAIRVPPVILLIHFMPTGAIVDNFLLVSQVAQVSANNRSKLFVFPYRLCGSDRDSSQSNERREHTAVK